MSCQACEEFQQSDGSSYFRWKDANIEICGCPEHLREVMSALGLYPNLLIALKKLREWHRDEYQSNPLIDAEVDEVIAKAEGRS
jgi:hypothetical protein